MPYRKILAPADPGTVTIAAVIEAASELGPPDITPERRARRKHTAGFASGRPVRARARRAGRKFGRRRR